MAAVGWRIGVYWREDQKFYMGELVSYNDEEDLYEMNYDDSEFPVRHSWILIVVSKQDHSEAWCLDCYPAVGAVFRHNLQCFGQVTLCSLHALPLHIHYYAVAIGKSASLRRSAICICLQSQRTGWGDLAMSVTICTNLCGMCR